MLWHRFFTDFGNTCCSDPFTISFALIFRWWNLRFFIYGTRQFEKFQICCQHAFFTAMFYLLWQLFLPGGLCFLHKNAVLSIFVHIFEKCYLDIQHRICESICCTLSILLSVLGMTLFSFHTKCRNVLAIPTGIFTVPGIVSISSKSVSMVCLFYHHLTDLHNKAVMVQ